MSTTSTESAAQPADVPLVLGVPRPVFAAAAVLLGSFLVGFDTRLFSVGLPDLRGAFGLSYDQGAWLNTFATAPQILIAPAVAWLAATFGVRRVLFWPSLVYAAISFVLPQVRDWHLLVALHMVRGLLLGVFIPATIMIIFRNLPTRWWVPALAIYAFRLAFSLNTGPLLIGLYDTHFGWQWIYWQDMILAPIIGGLVWLGSPHEKTDIGLLQRADWGGMALLGSGWALIYAGLDQGNRLDWFESGLITCLIGGGAALILGFFINEMLVRNPWASHKVIAKRNTAIALLIVLSYTATSLSNSQLVTGFLTTVVGLRPEQIGWTIFLTSGLPLLVTTPLAVLLVLRFDARVTIMIGFLAFAIAAIMGTDLSAIWGPLELHADNADPVGGARLPAARRHRLHPRQFRSQAGHRHRRLYPGGTAGRRRDRHDGHGHLPAPPRAVALLSARPARAGGRRPHRGCAGSALPRLLRRRRLPQALAAQARGEPRQPRQPAGECPRLYRRLPGDLLGGADRSRPGGAAGPGASRHIGAEAGGSGSGRSCVRAWRERRNSGCSLLGSRQAR